MVLTNQSNINLSFVVWRQIAVSLSPNPSHLEAVDAVVVGKTKAKQFFNNDVKQEKVLVSTLHPSPGRQTWSRCRGILV